MDRVKTLIKYVLWVALFWILSDFLIFVGLNSMYKPMNNHSNSSDYSASSNVNGEGSSSDGSGQFDVYQAESTLVNGRITGVIHNSPENDISGKYAEVELFSDQGVSLGKQYLDIGQVGPNDDYPFNIYFKKQHVTDYKLRIVDEKEPLGDFELLPKNVSFGEQIMLLILAYTLMF